MGNQHQPFLLFDPNGHSLVGAQTGIKLRHFQHGPDVVGGDSVRLREEWSAELIGKYGMGL